MSARVVILDDPQYGPVLRTDDADLADRLEDYFTETSYVLFNLRFEETGSSFFFGRASSVDKVRELYEQFLLSEAGQ